MVYTNHSWWFGGWFIIAIPTLLRETQGKTVKPHWIFFAAHGLRPKGMVRQVLSIWQSRMQLCLQHMVVSWNRSTSISSISIGLSIFNHPFGGTPIMETTIFQQVLNCCFGPLSLNPKKIAVLRISVILGELALNLQLVLCLGESKIGQHEHLAQPPKILENPLTFAAC